MFIIFEEMFINISSSEQRLDYNVDDITMLDNKKRWIWMRERRTSSDYEIIDYGI
jgi:hypothetical protein